MATVRECELCSSGPRQEPLAGYCQLILKLILINTMTVCGRNSSDPGEWVEPLAGYCQLILKLILINTMRVCGRNSSDPGERVVVGPCE